MDHLQVPKGSEPFLVPYLACEEYINDGGRFEYFPLRHGWTEYELYEDPDFGSRDPPVVAAFFQIWLYFGFLIDTVQVGAQLEFQIEDFVRQDDQNQKFVTTALLPEILGKWKSRDSTAPKKDVEPEEWEKWWRRNIQASANCRIIELFVPRFDAFQLFLEK